MISHNLKAAYYACLALPMRANAVVYRRFRAPGRNGAAGPVKVHLGPGRKNYIDGWVNVDANLFTAKIDVWADLRNRLPFRDGTVDTFYSHHVIEHLPDHLLPFHFAEMFRCLKPGGAIRVGGPNIDSAARKLVAGDIDWFSDFPDKRASVGGRFTNFLFCRGEHLTALTLSYLQELATAAGFVDVRQCLPITQTFHPQLIDQQVLGTEWETTPDCPHTLLIEADRPRDSR